MDETLQIFIATSPAIITALATLVIAIRNQRAIKRVEVAANGAHHAALEMAERAGHAEGVASATDGEPREPKGRE